MGANDSKMTLEGGKSSSDSKTLTIVIIILFLILIAVYLGIIFGLIKKDKVDYNECNKPQGEFALEAGVTYNSFVYGCDTNFDETTVCRFPSIANLTDAVNTCNQNSEKCDRFVYNQGTQILSFVPLGANAFSDNVNENSFTRQTNITYKTKGPSLKI